MVLSPSCAAALPARKTTAAPTMDVIFFILFILRSSSASPLPETGWLRRKQCRQIPLCMKAWLVRRLNGVLVMNGLRAAMIGLLSLAAGAPAAAADYPNRPVHWLIGFAAGGPVDVVARIMSQWLSEHFGQQFVVENRTGSGGNIAAAAAINSPPDGYTLLFVGPNNAISTSLYKHLPFDFIRDTVPVASIMQLTNLLVVANAMPVRNVQEFIDYCKANPGKVSYASSGNGTSVHISGEL